MENCYSIWLPSLIERYPIIKELEFNLKKNIFIFNAIDGKEYVEKFKNFKHVLYGQKINSGIIGCSLSHLELLKKNETITIFEDDCTFNGNLDELNSFIKNAPEFDILCLGVSEMVEKEEFSNPNYVKLYRFWGTHALIVKKEAAEKIVSTFEKYLKLNVFLPADWLYSYAIKEHNLKAYGPNELKKFFDYKRGIYSVIANRIRL